MTTMKRLSVQDMYELIPSIYRLRDVQNGYPLRALIEVLHSEGAKVEDNIAQLYDNWFIDTCEEWVVPYIGELLGIRGLRDLKDATGISRRAFVANTIGYRRRKGTPGVIEQLAFDITGRRAVTVEFFERLGWTQNMNHVKPLSGGPVSVTNADTMQLTGTPFDRLTRTVDVRSIEKGRGYDSISNVGVFLWHIPAYRIYKNELRAEGGVGRYYIHPTGLDAPLFNPPQSDEGISESADELHVPIPLRRPPLYRELETRREAMVNGREFTYRYFDNRSESRSEQAFEISINNVNVAPERICICDLSDWTRPSATIDYIRVNADGSKTTIPVPIDVAVDPVLGRVALPAGSTATKIRVSFSWGWPGDIGAGPYSRRDSIEKYDDRKITWQIGVSKSDPAVSGEIVATITEAIDAWNTQPAGTVGMIAILDNSIYVEDLTGSHRITIAEGSRLCIVSAQWPAMPVSDSVAGHTERRIGVIVPDQTRACLKGSVAISGSAPAKSELGGELFFNGLLCEGAVTVQRGNLGLLCFDHCTILPPLYGLSVALSNQDLNLQIKRSVCGPISTTASLENILVEDSIVHGQILAENTPLNITRSTILCDVTCLMITASESIFQTTLNARRRQTGCVRFCYVDLAAQTPRRYRCQPDLKIRDLPDAQKNAAAASVKPTFTSIDIASPSYCRLSRTCAQEITEGGENGTEMGAWNFQQEPFRLSNLKSQLAEYIRFGMSAGIESCD
jgi:hypothetical protein